MKRILISTYIDPEFYPPTKNAIFELAKNSLEVIVLTRNLFNAEVGEYPSNVTFRKVGRYMTVLESERINFISKILTFLVYYFNYQRILVGSRIDIVIFYDSIPLFTFLLGLKPSKVKYWYHNHDMPNIQLTQKYSIGWFSARYEFLAMKKIDYFSLPSIDRLIFYPNWTNIDRFFFIPNYPRFELYQTFNHRLRFENFTIIFQGSIGEGHGLEELIKILPKFPQIRLILKGSVRPHYKRTLTELIESNNAHEQVIWMGITSYKELVELTARCHLGIAIYQGQDDVSKTLGTASNKIYEYIACGLPIILHDSEQFRKNMASQAYVFFYRGQLDELSNIIRTVYDNFEQLSLEARLGFETKFTFERYFGEVMLKVNVK
jgi:glycosyltransferase involved in cell wall biosynthesis